CISLHVNCKPGELVAMFALFRAFKGWFLTTPPLVVLRQTVALVVVGNLVIVEFAPTLCTTLVTQPLLDSIDNVVIGDGVVIGEPAHIVVVVGPFVVIQGMPFVVGVNRMVYRSENKVTC